MRDLTIPIVILLALAGCVGIWGVLIGKSMLVLVLVLTAFIFALCYWATVSLEKIYQEPVDPNGPEPGGLEEMKL